jgi:collagen type IV alpha
MATSIYVSQLSTANSIGGNSSIGSILIIGSIGPYWTNSVATSILGQPLGQSAGYTGSTGYRGSAGYIGSTGYTGSVGNQGPDGNQGIVGFTGSAGPGYFGSTGYQGSYGTTGYQGSTGFTGSAGFTGSTGYQGSTGYVGSTGFFGSIGYQGSPGTAGSSLPFPFTTLTDVPQNYTGKANYFVRVNGAGNGLYFDSNTYVTNTFGVSVSFNGNTVFAPNFQGYSETINTVGNSGTPVTVATSAGNIATMILNQPVVQILLSTTGLIVGRAYSITLALQQDSTGSRTVDWTGQSVIWPAAEGIYSPSGPTLTTQAGYTDFVTLTTLSAGATWYGFLAAKGFPTTAGSF